MRLGMFCGLPAPGGDVTQAQGGETTRSRRQGSPGAMTRPGKAAKNSFRTFRNVHWQFKGVGSDTDGRKH